MISVIIGINRIDKFTDMAIQSIIKQTLKEIEIIIIANGHDHIEVANTLKKKYGAFDNIKIDKTPIGQLSYALNKGIELSKFDIIARMDSDDIAHPDRLSRQLKFLIENRLDLVGTDINIINENGENISSRKLPKGIKINKTLPFKNPFVHPTIIAKKEAILKARGYNSGFNSEDYDLWLRMKRIGVKWDNIPEELLDYRIHEAASQRRLLGYAESTSLAMREFVLNKSLKNLMAIFYHLVKSFIRPQKN